MQVPRRTVLLSAIVAALALPVLPALPAAAATAPLPETVLNVKSIDWQAKTGNLAVTARVKCTGDGTFRWSAALEQRNARARNASNVPCDGDGYLSTLMLDPRDGRFHPGRAALSTGGIVTGDGVGAGWLDIQEIRLAPR